jgi:hypothetical protein
MRTAVVWPIAELARDAAVVLPAVACCTNLMYHVRFAIQLYEGFV